MQKMIAVGIITVLIGLFVAASVKADTPTPSPTESSTTPTPTITSAPTQAVQGSTTIPSGAPKTGFGY